jgi:hypothetical protein
MTDLSQTKEEELSGEFFILGITNKGKQFRPSDWAERLCGVMACYCPVTGGPNAHLKFSSFVHPTLVNGIKAVVVDRRLQKVEPMAYHFVVGFAKDNDMQVVDACFVPLPGEKKPGAA